MNKKNYKLLLFLLVFLIAAFFRLYGNNWDQDQHLHPDERFLTMVTTDISWPENLWVYLDSATSPLNPHNRGFGFFVYGTFPIFFTRLVSDILDKTDYSNLTLVGRQLSAIFEILTVVVVYLIGRKIHFLAGILAMFFYATFVTPIQLAHFYAVDTYLTFFLYLTLLLFITLMSRKKTELQMFLSTGAGISFGLAIASKISAILFSPIILLCFLIVYLKNRKASSLFYLLIIFIFACYFTIRFGQPYLFQNPSPFDLTLNQKVIDNWKQVKAFDDPDGWFPPAVQWVKTKAYIFPLKNIAFWGIGIPLTVTFILALCYFLYLFKHQLKKFKISKQNISVFASNNKFIIYLNILWIVILFGYQGRQFVKALRYFYPSFPSLAIILGAYIWQINQLKAISQKSKRAILTILCLLSLAMPFAFISIYSRPHTRVAASSWIYQNIRVGAKISAEHWDDFVPLTLSAKNISQLYKSVEFPLYHVDNEEKWRLMDAKLKEVDYIILTSNRLYGSIMTVPNKYPVTYRYYQHLFNGNLGFIKIAEFTSRPNLPIPFIKVCLTPPGARYGIVAKVSECSPGLSLVDDYADETFTVYDHPKVIIFKKVKNIDYYNFLYPS